MLFVSRKMLNLLAKIRILHIVCKNNKIFLFTTAYHLRFDNFLKVVKSTIHQLAIERAPLI